MDEEAARPAVSATVADWARERRRRGEWNPGKALLAAIRDYQRGPRTLRGRVAVLRHRFWSAVSGADIPLNARIGGGLILPHPNGVVIHPGAIIGVNCLIFQQVTLGVTRGEPPRLGGHVDIGAGAKILGAVTLGDHCLVGANAVVLRDVPAGATVVGNPGRIVVARTSCD